MAGLGVVERVASAGGRALHYALCDGGQPGAVTLCGRRWSRIVGRQPQDLPTCAACRRILMRRRDKES